MEIVKKSNSSRYRIILVIVTILMAFLVVRLFSLSVFQHGKWNEHAEALSTKTITTTAPRGNIYDRNGNLLAGSKQIFTVKLYPGDMDNEELNQLAVDTIKLFEKNGDDYIDEFPIKINSDGKLYYTYKSEIKSWLRSQNMPTDLTAEEAFNRLRSNMDIPASYDKYEAQAAIQSQGVYPPISVSSTIRYSADIELANWLESFDFDSDLTAKEAFKALREKYEIDPDLSTRKARKILVIRNETHTLGYNKYAAVEIATRVSEKTIIEIEEDNVKFANLELATETVRYYPNGSTASHILGYMGAISSDNLSLYTDVGYSPDALVGKSGIENEFESYLKGTDGTKTIQVDAHGNRISTISEEDPVAGSDVYLTIDLDLQKTAEKALAKAIRCTRTGDSFSSKYGSCSMQQSYNCRSGAVVAIDVKTGEVLAMASYPDFDPNLFAEGISQDDWESVQSENTRDSLAPAPLYNIATMSAVQPGSTFKPCTATAALESGLNPDAKYRDAGYIKRGGKTFGCVVWNLYHGNHGYIDLYDALKVSCNYYFYDVAMGYDYAAGCSLGYKCGADKILSYAEEYGLGQLTGIELPETTSRTPSAESKMESMKSMLESMLWSNASYYFKESTASSDEKLTKVIDEIVGWTEENPSYAEVVERFEKLPIKDKYKEKLASTVKFDYYNQAKWTEGDVFNLAIGQGSNAYTPLQMCNYTATMGNGGTRNEVTIIKSVQGMEKRKRETTQVDVSQESLDAIIEGMRRVCNNAGGSLYSCFHNFPVTVVGKTGTAERSGKANPVSEVEYVKDHFSAISGGRFTWSDTKKEMRKIMEEFPDRYPTQDVAVRQALINLGGGSITAATIDQWKSDYESFAWTITMAPKDDPQIAVAVLLVQGKSSDNAGPVAREVIGKYLLDSDDGNYDSIDIDTELTK